MENDSGAMILLIVLIVAAFLLIVFKFAQFIHHFGRKKQYFLIEMHRASDYNEYRYWRRKLRCLYLCLIPFVSKRNVMKVYPIFFHRAKHPEKEKRSDGLFHIIAPSMLAICICAICLCGVSWAWFTASTSTGTTAIQSSSYKLLYQVGTDSSATELAGTGNTCTLTSDTTVITLKAAGTAGATGYCSIQIGDEIYYTEQIFVNDASAFTFTVRAPQDVKIILTPKWGTFSGTATIRNGDEITSTGSQQNISQTPDNAGTAEPSTESVAPTAPNSTASEDETTISEPSETEPTPAQPEESDTAEPATASETAPPENTMETHPEPSATGESDSN